MLLRFRIALVGLLFTALAACSGGGGGGGGTPAPTPTPTPSPTPTPTPSPITISNSGATNVAAYTIVVNYSDSVVVTRSGNTSNATVSAASVTQLFNDVILYAPMNKVLTADGCTKSASYGTATTITYLGSMSGDVSCPPTTTSPAQTLYTDTQNIENQLNLPYG